MPRSRDAYVDTSALIAFVDRSDTHHPLFRRLFARPPRLVTTALVVAEGHAWVLRRYDRSRALQFMAMIEDAVRERRHRDAARGERAVPGEQRLGDEAAGGARLVRRGLDDAVAQRDRAQARGREEAQHRAHAGTAVPS